MKILFATTEAVPFAKTGGLGDVCGSLPQELANLGHEPVVIMPAFRQALQLRPADRADRHLVRSADRAQDGRRAHSCAARCRQRSSADDVPVYLVEHNGYFDRPDLYNERGKDYRDNCERFVFFARAALEAITLLDLGTEVVHAHDWTAGLVPAYLKTTLRGVPPYDSLVSMLTVHNIAYQGSFWHWDMELTGIDWKYFNWQQMEYYGNLNFLKSGLAFADVITTVSPRYAQEIQYAAAELRHGRHPLAPPRRLVRHHQRRRLRRVESGDRSALDSVAQLRRPQLHRRQAGLQSGAATGVRPAASSKVSRWWR